MLTLLPLIVFLFLVFGLASIGVVAVMTMGMADDSAYKRRPKPHRQHKRREIARFLRRIGHDAERPIERPFTVFVRKHKMLVHVGCLLGIACCLVTELFMGGHFRIADWTFLVLALACEVS